MISDGKNWKLSFAAFLGAQVLSIFGSSMVQYTIIWHITLVTQSGVFATASILCNLLPMLLLMPFVGVWADRYNRKVLINLSDGFMALIALGTAVLYSAGHGGIYVLLAALFIRSFAAAVQNPSVNAMIPDFVPEEKLTRMNSIYASLYGVAQILAPLLAASMVKILPLAYIFYLDVITASVAIVILGLGLKVKHRPYTPERSGFGGYMHDIKEGFRYIARTPLLRGVFLFMTCAFFMFTPVFYLTPLYVTQTYGDEVWYLSAIEVALTAGMLVGGLIMSVWGGFKSKRNTFLLGQTAMAILSVVMGFSLPLFVFLGAVGVYGLANAVASTPLTVIMQQYSDKQYIGRVFSVFSILNTAMMQIAMLVCGPLAEIVNIRWMYTFCGAFMCIANLSLLSNQALKKI